MSSDHDVCKQPEELSNEFSEREKAIYSLLNNKGISCGLCKCRNPKTDTEDTILVLVVTDDNDHITSISPIGVVDDKVLTSYDAPEGFHEGMPPDKVN